MTDITQNTRPSGTASNKVIDLLLSQFHIENRRRLINQKITDQTGQPLPDANKPSAHLRWALQQMKLRGWRNDDWGALFDDRGKLGTGPICLLEAVGSGADAPGCTIYESAEQFYLRSAFVALGQEVPLYLSNWNDEQETFEPVETVLLKAIELAEADEAEGRTEWGTLNQDELNERWGFTPERLEAARAKETAN